MAIALRCSARIALRGAALDVGASDGFYSFLAEVCGARRVVAIDNEQYVDWVRARFGVTLTAGRFRAIAGPRVAGRVSPHGRAERARARRALRRRVVFRDPAPGDQSDRVAAGARGRASAGGEVVLETYGSHLSPDTPAIEIHEPGDVYARDDSVYWGFSRGPAATGADRRPRRVRGRRPAGDRRSPADRRTATSGRLTAAYGRAAQAASDVAPTGTSRRDPTLPCVRGG